MKTKLLKKLRKKVKNDVKYNYVDDLVCLYDSNLKIYLTLKVVSSSLINLQLSGTSMVIFFISYLNN